ncbi:MAG: hypothetical protein PHX51_08635 [Clostridia bacterium]|nr:hypothetical protein [Clostridia bacterium]
MTKEFKKAFIPRISTGEFELKNYDDSYSTIVDGFGCANCLGSMLAATAIGYCNAEDCEESFRGNRYSEKPTLCIMAKANTNGENKDGMWFHVPEEMILDPQRNVLEYCEFEGKDYKYDE